MGPEGRRQKPASRRRGHRPILAPMGTLYLVSTPIGNLEDLTFRAVRVLGDVDLILAEDTRRTGQLLHHLELRVPMLSLHEHNEEARIRDVLERLDEGKDLALVSDAGTPLVSDPGERLVAQVLAQGHAVTPVPGPSAVLTALIGSGLPTRPFTFLGFLPRKGSTRKELLERVAAAAETTILFESPERTSTLLAELAGISEPGRRGVVARELTKLHEEFRRGTLEELSRYYSESPPRGEVTVVVAPRSENSRAREEVDVEAARALATALLQDGRSPSRAAREVARRLGLPRNQVYALVQEVAGQRDGPSSDTSST